MLYIKIEIVIVELLEKKFIFSLLLIFCFVSKSPVKMCRKKNSKKTLKERKNKKNLHTEWLLLIIKIYRKINNIRIWYNSNDNNNISKLILPELLAILQKIKNSQKKNNKDQIISFEFLFVCLVFFENF